MGSPVGWYGDPERLRRGAAAWESMASDVRGLALLLRDTAANVAWVSVNAERWLDEVRQDLHQLGQVADQLERAARRLRLHAEQVDRRIGGLLR